MTRFILLITLALGSFNPLPAFGFDEAAVRALDRFHEPSIRAHMNFLAHDLLEGRGTGSDGYRIAANYVAAQFELMGLLPYGTDGYFQGIDFRSVKQVDEACRLSLVEGKKKRDLARDEDFIMMGDPVHESSRGEAGLVFVGFGVSAPELGYDDYTGVDVRGKVVVLMRGAPPTFPHNQRAYHSSSTRKNQLAADAGAVGILTFFTRQDAEKRSWEKTVTNNQIPRMRTLRPDGSVHGVFPQFKVGAVLSVQGARAVFAGTPSNLEEVHDLAESGSPYSFDLGKSLRFERKTRHETAFSPNVAGLIPGSDPVLSREIVLYSAHLDHLGVGAPVKGDAIYNGAFDNASGVAVMIEVARAFSALPRAPARSILFLAVTGEEKGLLGSEYFAEYPTVTLGDVVGNVNLDMFLMLHPLRSLVAFGAEHSTLGETVESASNYLGLRTIPDPMPEEVIFVRSDQYSFVKKGVPSVFLVAGMDSGDPAIDGKAMFDHWLKAFYHTQFDDMSQKIDFGAGVVFSQANFLIGYQLAEQAERPRWNPGDFFGERFAGSRP